MNTAIAKPLSFERPKKEKEYSIHEAAEDIKLWVDSISGLAAMLSSHLESVDPNAWSGGEAEHHDVCVLVNAIGGLCDAIKHRNELDIIGETRSA